MAKSELRLLILLLVTVFVQLGSGSGYLASLCRFSSIISFGDSLTDTGNLLIIERNKSDPNAFGRFFGKHPYGMTHFYTDSGRASHGRIVIDFVAEALKLPSVPPYLGGPDSHGFKKGVNFAVSGATALDVDFYAARGIQITITNASWSVQHEWFKQLLPSLCRSKLECKQFLGSSLIFVGEIGGNDYNFAFLHQRNLTEMRTFIPLVVRQTSNTISMLARLGAKTLVVPNIPPLGCNGIYLTIFGNSPKDDVGCAKLPNDFLEEHNQQLRTEVHRLQKRFPDVELIYADFYGAIFSILRSASKLGFTNPFGVCCGTGGPYNWNPLAICGAPGTKVCKDPTEFVDWDGIHYTEPIYKILAKGLLEGPFAVPPITHACLKFSV